MKKTLLLTLLAIILSCGTCLAQSGNAPEGKSTFYASHSLMWDMPPVLTEVAESYGIKGHKVLGIQRLGVSRTSQHWDLPDNQNQAKKILKEGNADAFVMSPIGMPDQGIDSFVKLGLEHNPDTKFYIQISWPGMGLVDNNDMESMMGGMFRGPGGGGPPGKPPGGAPAKKKAVPGGPGGFGGGMFGGNRDYNKSPEEIVKINVKNNRSAEELAKKLNRETGRKVVYLIPTAQAHNALRLMIYNKEIPGMTDQGEVFRDFIGHPTDPVIALNAYLHFAVMYGVSPVGLPVPDILKNSAKPEYREEKFNRALQELAWKTVINYPQSGVKAPAGVMQGKGEYRGMEKILIPHKSWACGMAEGIPVPEQGVPVLVADMKLDQTYELGRTQYGQRAVYVVKGGTITGEKIKGSVMFGGLDFQLSFSDGMMEVEEIFVLQTEDGKYIYLRIAGTAADSSDVRIVPEFEAPSAGEYNWLNTGKYAGRREVDIEAGTMKISVYDVSGVVVKPDASNSLQVTKPSGFQDQSWDYRRASAEEKQGDLLIEENVTLGRSQSVGATGKSNRNIIPITGGTVTGKLEGKVLAAGADYQNLSNPATIDARYLWQTNDGEVIIIRNAGGFGKLAPTFEVRVDSKYAYLNEGLYLSSPPGMGSGGVSLTFYESVR
ncbi:DUF3237 domain-containing protein [Thermodesulfobacteriota bacterium]